MIHSDVKVVEKIVNKKVVNQRKHFSGNRNNAFFVTDFCTVRSIPNAETVFARTDRDACTLAKNGFQVRISGHDFFGFDLARALIVARG